MGVLKPTFTSSFLGHHPAQFRIAHRVVGGDLMTWIRMFSDFPKKPFKTNIDMEQCLFSSVILVRHGDVP
jgi:hypothetical protein